MVTAPGVTAAQIAIAWSLAKGVPVILLPGAKCVVYLEDNLGALAIDLMDGEVTQYDAAFSSSAASDRPCPAALPCARQQ